MQNSFKNDTPPNVILALTPDSSYAENGSSPTSQDVPEKRRWSCHKDVLKSNSNYFKSILSSQFQEAEAAIVFLPRGMFSASVLDALLCYMYTHTLSVKEDLELLQSLYLAADYLGMEELCEMVERQINTLTHGLCCYCERCIDFVPQLLAFAGSNQENESLSEMTQTILKLLVQDPERSLPTFWSSHSMVILLTQNPEMESLHEYLEKNVLSHVNRHNAIESLYGCFLAEQALVDKPFDTELLVSTLKKVKESGALLLANDFIFYCTKYPKLLSCVDGITYSFEFLNYLISIVLDKEKMNERNVCSIYTGIVKHLMCRDNAQMTIQVKNMLQSAKDTTIDYISTNIVTLKKLNLIDRNAIELLAHDLSISPNALITDHDEKKRQAVSTTEKKPCHQMFDWNFKLIRSRLSSLFFGRHFKVGQRIQLMNRPISTTGTIVYTGKISTDPNKKQMEYRLGILLDRRVGTCDGSINGKRYFTTCSNRGVFVKPSDVILL
ncbi:hypothetical protein CU098_006342 [Rhizopus stolonifer]|uniref:CAP-Gly domain-containing protein n=1 Tax=Rhizopus stolonifer TaxID=4846 RepID=A0A367KU56_RHIST|nr:hypothetical protein CU098_006342 [Rhizopus stolonifer]